MADESQERHVKSTGEGAHRHGTLRAAVKPRKRAAGDASDVSVSSGAQDGASGVAGALQNAAQDAASAASAAEKRPRARARKTKRASE